MSPIFRRWSLVVTMVILASTVCFPSDELPVRVMSFNIRFGTAKDGVNHWDKRKDFLVETIKDFDPDLLGTQETLAFQRDFIQDRLGKYASFGVGRVDGKDDGEMAALFFNQSRFEKLEGGHFWLSPTPEVVGSKGWDAALPRIATWVKLRDKSAPTTAAPILFLNTHFDHQGSEARSQSARLIRDRVTALGSGCRVIITGDFNADANSGPYKSLFENVASRPEQILLQDTYRNTSSPHLDPSTGTFSGFKAANTDGARIDWIACSSQWQVRQARIDRTQIDGRTPSDHFPITAVLRSVDTKPTLRVLSYNIHHGEGLDKLVDLNRIASVIRNADPDIVALQEVDRNTKRTGHVDQASELARLTGMYSTFAKAIDFEGGEYGQTILSRFPLTNVETTKLANRDNREQRIAVSAVFEFFRNYRIQFISTHLDHSEPNLRLEQAAQLANLSSPTAELSILAGDMNDLPESDVLDTLRKSWKLSQRHEHLPTSPATSPTRQIDYILVRDPNQPVDVSSRVIEESVASDHRPIFLSIGFQSNVHLMPIGSTVLAKQVAEANIELRLQTPVITSRARTDAEWLQSGTLIFHDAFEREEDGNLAKAIGNGWNSATADRVPNIKMADLDGGVLKIDSATKEAGHAAHIHHEAGFTDGGVSVRFKFPGLNKDETMQLGFVDRETKGIHAGHLCYAILTTSNATLIDHKTGVMNLDIRQRRQGFLDRKEPLPADLDAILKTKQVVVPWKADNEWHDLVLVTEGDEMRISLDGRPLTQHRSLGFSHPVKRWFSFLVPSTVWVDDVKIWKVK